MYPLIHQLELECILFYKKINSGKLGKLIDERKKFLANIEMELAVKLAHDLILICLDG